MSLCIMFYRKRSLFQWYHLHNNNLHHQLLTTILMFNLLLLLPPSLLPILNLVHHLGMITLLQYTPIPHLQMLEVIIKERLGGHSMVKDMVKDIVINKEVDQISIGGHIEVEEM